MDLWIRSQDRTKLIKCNWLNNYKDETIVEYDGQRLYTIENDGTDLGAYKTEERALEVLDEIQRYLRFLTNAQINKNDFLRYLNEFCDKDKCNKILDNISVYEMPKE